MAHIEHDGAVWYREDFVERLETQVERLRSENEHKGKANLRLADEVERLKTRLKDHREALTTRDEIIAEAGDRGSGSRGGAAEG